VLLGHWEIRRRIGETDEGVNRKVRAALQANLYPILLVGESAAESEEGREVLALRLARLFSGCEPEQVARMVVVYEPEWTIGVREPASPDTVAAGCSFIRQWIGQEYGTDIAARVRIIYGGSVAPEYARDLMASSEVDGLGAGRKGRVPVTFAEIVQLIAMVEL
jgi:triosephosphate isomerase